MGTTSVVNDKVFSPTVRWIIYLAAGIVLIVAVVFHLITQDQASDILNYVAAFLGIAGLGLASLNKPVPTNPPANPPVETESEA